MGWAGDLLTCTLTFSYGEIDMNTIDDNSSVKNESPTKRTRNRLSKQKKELLREQACTLLKDGYDPHAISILLKISTAQANTLAIECAQQLEVLLKSTKTILTKSEIPSFWRSPGYEYYLLKKVNPGFSSGQEISGSEQSDLGFPLGSVFGVSEKEMEELHEKLLEATSTCK